MEKLTLTDFLAAFFPDASEPIYLRAFKAKDAPDALDTRPLKWQITRAQLGAADLQNELTAANKTRGLYFVVNAGGNRDQHISRFNAFFVENDNLPLAEQHRRLDAAPVAPSIRIETKKSVHAYWLLSGDCAAGEWKEMQRRLIDYFEGDKSIHNPSRVMRLPFFNHVAFDPQNGEYSFQRVGLIEFDSTRHFNLAEMQTAFPAAVVSHDGANKQRADSPPSFAPPIGDVIANGSRHREILSLAGTMRWRGMSAAEMFAALQVTNETRCQPPLDETEVRRLCDDVANRYEPDGNKSANSSANKNPANNGSSNKNSSNSGSTQSNANQPKSKLAPLHSVCLADVTAKQVKWLWKGFLVRGSFNLIDGEEGLGKSFVTLAIASAVASGAGCAAIGLEPAESVTVLLISSAENALSFVVKPRLLAMNAPLDKIIAVDEAFNLDDDGFLRLEMKIAETGAVLVIIDPLFSFTGKINIYTDNEIKRITDRLNRIAETHDCAIWGVRHVNKARGFGDARTAGMGGVGWNSGSRSSLLVGKDRSTGETAVCQYKTNFGELSKKSFGFKIEKTHVTLETGETIETGKFFWTGESRLTARRMLTAADSEDNRAAESDAVAFLREALRDKRREPNEVKKEAARHGITPKQLRTARSKLGVEWKREGYGKDQKTVWNLPAADASPETAANARRPAKGHLRQNDDEKTSSVIHLAADAKTLEKRHLHEPENMQRASADSLLFDYKPKIVEPGEEGNLIQTDCWKCRTPLHGATICPNCGQNQDEIPF